MQFTLERYDPSYDKAPFFPMIFISAPHWARYKWAAQYCKNKRLLDIACGSGYGLNYLAQFASEAIGIDCDPVVIRYCQEHYADCTFICDDAQGFSLQHPVDVVVSLETIEHLPKPDLFLERVRMALAPDGIFLCSTPILGVVPKPPHHIKEYPIDEFRELLGCYFKQIDFQFQTMKWDIGDETYHDTQMFALAICSGPFAISS